MLTIAATITLLGAVGSTTAVAQAVDARPQLESLYAAIERGDTAALGPKLSADLRWVIGSGAVINRHQLLSAASAPTPARFSIDSVHASSNGETLIVDYIRRDRWPLGDSSFTAAWRAVAAFTRTQHEWQLVRHSLAWLAVTLRSVAAITMLEC